MTAVGCGSSQSTVDGSGDASFDNRNNPTPLGLSCSPGVSPTIPLLTDFSPTNYNVSKGKWGFTGNLTGTIVTFKNSDGPSAPRNESAATAKVVSEALALSGQYLPEQSEEIRLGGGLQFDSCVDATNYRGVQFNLSGTSGSCEVYFQLQTYSQEATTELGGCASYCYRFPWKKVAPHAGTTVVTFSELANTGIPATADKLAAEIVGVRWLVHAPTGQDGGTNIATCIFNLTIDDVRLVR
jgi:hypothetical protein